MVSDHFKQSTMNMLVKNHNVVSVFFEGHWREQRHEVETIKLKHGADHSYGFKVHDVCYITDVNSGDGGYFKLVGSDFLENLRFAAIEANHDVPSRIQLLKEIQIGYDRYGYGVIKASNRHMFVEEFWELVNKFQPQEIEPLHMSSRFCDITKLRSMVDDYNHGRKRY